VVQQTK